MDLIDIVNLIMDKMSLIAKVNVMNMFNSDT
jgi:hypothetical protein